MVHLKKITITKHPKITYMEFAFSTIQDDQLNYLTHQISLLRLTQLRFVLNIWQAEFSRHNRGKAGHN